MVRIDPWPHHVLVLALLIAGMNGKRALAQEQMIDPEKTVRVSVGKSSVQPEQTGMVPIYFAAPENTSTGKVVLHVTYVSANVHFDRVESGPAAESVKAALTSEVKVGQNENGVPTETVTITATVPLGAAQGIPTGLLAYLTLRASAEARPAKIAMRSSASATRAGSDTSLPDVQSFDGELEVQAPNTGPAVVCFFFTH